MVVVVSVWWGWGTYVSLSQMILVTSHTRARCTVRHSLY